MSKLADYDNLETRITLLSEELKEIVKRDKISPEVIDIVAEQYIDMVCCYGLMVFPRDTDKIEELIGSEAEAYTTEKLMELFDKEGIDYIVNEKEIYH